MPDDSPVKKRKKKSSDSSSEDEKEVKKKKTEGDDKEANKKEANKKVEREIEDLCRERGRIEDALRRMEDNHKKFLHTLEANELRKIKQEEEKKKAAGKKARESGDESSGDDKDKKKDEKVEKEPRKRPHRERALFGFLQNQLKKAKKDLDDEKGTKAKDKVDLDKPLGEVKLSASGKAQQEAKENAYKERRSKEESRLHEIDKMLQQKETVLLQGRLENHYSLMMNFIRTKAEPTIFYLPAKHTSTTEKFLQETRQAIKNKIASLSVQLQPLEPSQHLANGVSKEDDEGDEEKDNEKKDSDSDGDEGSIPEGAPTNRAEAGEDEKSDKSDGEQ